ncbi:hypothetical protein GGR06_002766 [Bacteroides reticulotermitis]|uniref:Uncharacterized protein n=1 Tax=Bacteroides reticulotermitis TaxID=1133319 RepID=A0A840D647_9BACE|nr:hypothetical protein [Bacteroides reticulotermitis]
MLTYTIINKAASIEAALFIIVNLIRRKADIH